MRILALFVALLLALPTAGCGYDAYLDAEDQPGARYEGDGITVKWTAPPFTWNAQLPDPRTRLEAEPGGTWTLPYELTVDLSRHDPAIHRPLTHIVVGVLGEWRHDEQGRYRPGAITHALSANFTTTGIGVERWDGWPRFKALHGKDGSPFEGVVEHELPAGKLGLHTFKGTVEVTLPADTPVGWYEPRFHVLTRVEDVADPVHLSEFAYEWNDFVPGNLPLVKVGQPKGRRIPWTILAKYPFGGRVGVLPRQDAKTLQLLGRSGFTRELILRPGTYELSPSMPSLFPRDSMPQVDGGDDVLTERFDHYLNLGDGEVRAKIQGPTGKQDLGSKRFAQLRGEGIAEDEAFPRPKLQGGGFEGDFSETGHYQIELTGSMGELFGRRVTGGGTYDVTVAHPLSMSTSCKPGQSFLVGNGYPAKINVNPPFAAEVEVVVEWFPNSDPSRKQTWTARGTANRFGHFKPYDTPPIIFDEPGEYASYVTIRHVDGRGELWFAQQTSSGVVAPVERDEISLHGVRSFPWVDWAVEGAKERFADRTQVSNSFLPQTNLIVQDPFVPFHAEDTLFMPVNYSEENTIQPKFSFSASNPDLARFLSDAHSRRSALPIPWNQPPGQKLNYLHDVVDHATEAFAYFPTKPGPTDEIPIGSLGSDGWHPFGFPQKKTWEAYVYAGVIRPGFPVLTSVHEVGGKGFYWTATPNVFGQQFNRGLNGDSPEDVYRVTAGMVLKDLEGKRNYYDTYASTIVFKNFEGSPGGMSILEPGARTIRTANNVDFKVFLASDTHDTLEVGEKMGLGGIVLPVVEADVEWKVTKPSGTVVFSRATANRIGMVRGRPLIDVDEPGVYKVEPVVTYEGLTGTLPGLVDGSFSHFAVPVDSKPILTSNVPARTKVTSVDGYDIELSWPKELTDTKLTFGVIMPGQVLDQGVVDEPDGDWTYYFQPIQWSSQAPNFDSRDYGSGDWQLAETMVFQFFLEGTNPEGERVYDALRLFLRRDMLYNYRAFARAK
jgi:hypothetical protein